MRASTRPLTIVPAVQGEMHITQLKRHTMYIMIAGTANGTFQAHSVAPMVSILLYLTFLSNFYKDVLFPQYIINVYRIGHCQLPS